MTEVCNCGGGHRTRLREDLVPLGCPLPMYIKEGGREAVPLGARQEYGVLLGLPSPGRGEGGGGEKGGGGAEGEGRGAGAPFP